jgi:DNA-binding CsgD family transcriptional regulator
MFYRLFERLTGDCIEAHQRPDGVAFFKAAKELYGFSAIAYLGMNIEVLGRPGHYLHCEYSDSHVKHGMTCSPLGIEALEQEGLAGETPVEWLPSSKILQAPAEDGQAPAHECRGHVFSLRSRAGETAVFGITANMTGDDWERHKRTGMRDIKILGNYFHSHVLRINGYDAESDMIVSARELDCLKWTAAGKTAWEASVILGISERTVRFHLNAAREKLNCATTTQAVAKAIGYQLIDV